MKKLKSIVLVFTAAICLASCTDWLDLKPFDQILDDELYSTERGMNTALNGVYINMSNAFLYGKNLSYYSIEMLGGRYISKKHNTTSNIETAYLPFYDYTENDEIRPYLDNIFTSAYELIRDVNYFIAKVQDSNVTTQDKKDILLGEGYALRAFLHFDMLRLYGYPPVLNIKGKGIPYYTKASNDWQQIKENGEVITLLLQDIDKALDYLKDDPILSIGVAMDDSGYDFYNVYRNRRLNYFAVQTLKARVLLYKGDAASIAAAGELAKEMIESEAFQTAFPWGKNLRDYAYTEEVMFGISVLSMYTDWSRWFNTSTSDQFSVLPTTPETLAYMYNTGAESYINSNDQRAQHWSVMALYDNLRMTTKFAEPTMIFDYNTLYFQPLMRKSEVYLIAAEAFQDPSYVDAIRVNRAMKAMGETDSMEGYDLQEQIRKEYMKETVSEGQMFYYYKRRAETKIWGTYMTSAAQPAMGEVTIDNPGVSYVPPMPKKETQL